MAFDAARPTLLAFIRRQAAVSSAESSSEETGSREMVECYCNLTPNAYVN